MALAVAVGFVVDDAIVVIENIVRFLEAGDTPFDAALKGAQQICFTVLSITISLVAVFIPLIFMTGLVGRLLHEFAVTLTAAVVTSGLVNPYLHPDDDAAAFSSTRREPRRRRAPFSSALARSAASSGFHRAYERGLRWVLGGQRLGCWGHDRHHGRDRFTLHHRAEGVFPQHRHGTIARRSSKAPQDVSFTAFAAARRRR